MPILPLAELSRAEYRYAVLSRYAPNPKTVEGAMSAIRAEKWQTTRLRGARANRLGGFALNPAAISGFTGLLSVARCRQGRRQRNFNERNDFGLP